MENESLGKIISHAFELEADKAKIISTKDIVVGDWVRLKCQYGCGGYGRYFTCPPYSPTPDETRRTLKGYESALIIGFSGFKSNFKNPDIHEIMFDMERLAFLEGFYKAFAYTGGPCRLCQNCPASDIEYANEFSRRLCKNPSKARPAMEACGIDVFATVKMAGFDIDVVRNVNDCYRRFGLLLLE